MTLLLRSSKNIKEPGHKCENIEGRQSTEKAGFL